MVVCSTTKVVRLLISTDNHCGSDLKAFDLVAIGQPIIHVLIAKLIAIKFSLT
jgi:hypothetical protein